MKTLLFLTALSISATSCGSSSSPEKRMNIRNQELNQKIEILSKQQKILRDSILILKKEVDAIKFR